MRKSNMIDVVNAVLINIKGKCNRLNLNLSTLNESILRNFSRNEEYTLNTLKQNL